MFTLSVRREKRRGKKQTIVGENSTTISRHASSRVEEDPIVHPRRRQKVKFDHWVV
jgi:hypothetical protein